MSPTASVSGSLDPCVTILKLTPRGGGGGATQAAPQTGKAGGSGIVIFSISKDAVVFFGASHVFTQSALGNNIVYTVTAGDDDIRVE